jgi:hypothetical protein
MSIYAAKHVDLFSIPADNTFILSMLGCGCSARCYRYDAFFHIWDVTACNTGAFQQMAQIEGSLPAASF